MSFCIPARVRIALALLLLTIGFASAASAATATFQILLDLDNSQATGCTVPGLSGTFQGVDQILITTVTTSSGVAQVTALQVQTCTAPPSTFSAPAPVAAPAGHPLPWPVGINNGTGGTSVIETYYPLSLSPVGNPLMVRLGVLGFDNSGTLTDEMVNTQPGSGFPIILQAGSIAEVPTLGAWGLILLSLVLAFAAVAVLRRRRTAGTILLALLLLGGAGIAWAAAGACDLDGTTTGEWSSGNLLATDGSDASAGADMRAFYGFKDAAAGALCFRIDANLEFTTPQTITFTSAAPAGATVSGPTYTVTATASSGLPVTLTIDPSASAVCTISGSTVSFIGVGTCVIDGNQAGNATFDPAPQAQQSFAVGKGAQTVNFTSTAPASATVGGPTYNVTATASPSGLPVALTIDPSASAVCSISGSTVSFTAVGTCVVDGDQAGDANYNAAPQAQQSFTVGKGDQTISFTSTAPAAATVAGPTYNVTATASPSGLPVSFTIDATATSVCSISGSTVSFLAAGTCVIDANQAGDTNYNAAPQVQQSFTVGKGDQTISFTSTAPASAAVGGATYNVTATATSGLTVALTIDPSASTVCSIAGSTVSFLSVGTCVIDGNQAGDANYNAAPQVQQTFTVGKGSQTINFTSTAPAAATVGGATYNVTATATPSGLTVALTIDPSASTVCSIAGSTVSFIGVGTCVIDGNQAGDVNYNAAPQAQQSFAVGKGSQTISFTSTAPAAATVGGATYNVTATASPSGLPVTFTIDATASTVCSIAGSTVSFIGVGTCVIDANQPGNVNYNAAPQVQQSFAVAKGNQTISFTSTAPVAASVGGATYTVTATASPSGLPVTFTIDATASTVCTISGSTVSFIGVGTCVIDANQPGNANYNAAPQVQQSFAVAKGNQTISFTSTAPVAASVGGATYAVTATASPSGLPVTFTIDATASTVCTISGSTVSFIGVGTCVIDANQPGNANYNAAPQAQQSFAVAKGNQTISFTSTAPVAASVGGATYAVTATASPSGLPVTFTIDATASTVCTISGSTVSFIGVGTCVIDANQPGNASYNAAPQAQQSFAVAKGNQTISFTSTAPVGATVSGPTYTVTATASPSGLPVTFTIDATASTVCTISGSTVSFIGVGTCVIDANQPGNASYNAAPQVQQSFAVAKGNQTISFTSTAPAGATVNGPTYTVTATATSGLPVTLTIDATASTVCTISGSTVSFIGAGTCVIDANQPGNANFNAAPQVQQSFPVVKGNQTISFTSTAPAGATVGGATYTVTATATSGLPVTFTIDATATSVCTISGSTVSFLTVGTCVIDANQAGNASFNAAPQVQQSFAVGKGSQTISYTSTAPVGATVGGATYTVTATATSGLPVTFTIDASATTVCSISGSTVSFIGAGTCVIDANQAGNANYNAAPQAQQSFAVGKGSQTISYTSTAPVGATVGGATYTVTATATSGLPVTFTIDPVATAVCSLSGSTVSFIGAGTCVIDANQAGNANYNAAPQAQQSFAVAKGNQTISFTSTAPASASVGGPTYTVTATATSGLPVAFTTATPAVCTVSGSTVSFVGPGTCTINANQAGNANYNAAPQVQQSFSVFQAPQITSAASTSFTSTQPGTFTVTTTGNPTGASMVISASGALPSGVTFVNNNDGTATLAGTPAAGTQGTYPIVITANNGIPPNATQNFTLTVLNLVPQPIALPKENFDTVGNVQFEFDGTPTLQLSINVVGNLVANFTDPDGPSPLTMAGIPGCADVAAPFDCSTANGGTIHVLANGEFTFAPKAGDVAASDSFQYQVTDSLSPSVARTVTINLKSRAWFVKNTAPAGGQGRSNDPFNTLASAQTASLAGDYIFVYGGDLTTTGQAAGITLKANQKLWGEPFGLTVATTVNGVANPALVAVNAANRPKIDNPAAGGNAVGITNVAGVQVRGLSLAANTNAVNVTTSAAGAGGATIIDNVITGSGQQGIRVVAGGTGGTTVTMQNNTVSATGNGIDARTTAGATVLDIDNTTVTSAASGILVDGSGGGTTTITGFSNNAINGNTAGSGILVTTATFDSTPGGAFQTVSGGATVIGASGNGVGASGMVLTGVSGDLAFTDLDIFADNGAGLRASGTTAYTGSAGFQIGFPGVIVVPVATTTAVGGPAVDLSTVAMSNFIWQLVSSVNSATTGVAFNSVTGTFSAATGGIMGSTGTAFQVGSSNATISYVPAINVTAGKGVDLTSNVGSTISFTGTLTLSTGTNTAFNATGGGTVTTTDAASTLTTTTGTALNVVNTTIGAGGLKFKSISANGAASGIVLNNTGAPGGLTVIGTGVAASGGTIQNTTSHGVSLTSTLSPSFDRMNIQNTVGSGVKGTTVTNFTFTNGSINNSGTGGGTDESNIAFNTSAVGTENNVSGTVTITGNSLTNSRFHGIDILNFNGTLSNVTLTGNTLTSATTAANSLGSGIRLQASGSASTVANITKATLSSNTISNFPTASGILINCGNPNAAGSGGTCGTPATANNISITGNTIKGQASPNQIGSNAIAVSVTGGNGGSRSQANFDISTNGTLANPLTNFKGSGIACTVLGMSTATCNVATNVIVANNIVASRCISVGVDRTLAATDTPDLTATITGNNVSACDGNDVFTGALNSNGTARVKVQNNTLAAPLTGNRAGIQVNSGTPAAAGTNTTVCLNISGNTSAGSGVSTGIGLRKEGTVATTNAFGVNAMAATASPGVESFVDGLNPAGGGTTLTSATSGFTNCSLP